MAKNGVVVADKTDSWLIEFTKANPDETGNAMVEAYAEERHITSDRSELWKSHLKPHLMGLIEKGLVSRNWEGRRYRQFFSRETPQVTRHRDPVKINQTPPAPVQPEVNLNIDEVKAWLQNETRLMELVELLGAERVEAACKKAAAMSQLKREYDEKMRQILAQ